MNIVKETESESMATRVALHPFLAGMGRSQLALLIDCAKRPILTLVKSFCVKATWRTASI